MKNVSWITDLKLRGGYGIMGNQLNVLAINPFTTYGAVKASSFYDIAGTTTSIISGFQRTHIGNPDAKWEKNAATLKQLHGLRERIKALEQALKAAQENGTR